MDDSEVLTTDLGEEAAANLSLPSLRDVRVLMVGVTGFCVFLNVYATQTLLPLFTRIFHATKFQVSLTVSATTIGIALAAPFFGLVGERFGRRRTMAASVSLLTIPVLLAATSSSLQMLIAWRFLQGLIMPGIIAVTLAYISEEWSEGGAASVMAHYTRAHGPMPLIDEMREVARAAAAWPKHRSWAPPPSAPRSPSWELRPG